MQHPGMCFTRKKQPTPCSILLLPGCSATRSRTDALPATLGHSVGAALVEAVRSLGAGGAAGARGLACRRQQQSRRGGALGGACGTANKHIVCVYVKNPWKHSDGRRAKQTRLWWGRLRGPRRSCRGTGPGSSRSPRGTGPGCWSLREAGRGEGLCVVAKCRADGCICMHGATKLSHQCRPCLQPFFASRTCNGACLSLACNR